MSINQHQFEQLTEMGISLWQQRADENKNDRATAQTEDYLEIDLNDLANQQLFNDILLAVGIISGEVSNQGNYLDLGLFNWYFINTASHEQHQNQIQWQDHRLITPSIANISQSPILKKQLWHLLGKQA
jgi:hypothetical protein